MQSELFNEAFSGAEAHGNGALDLGAGATLLSRFAIKHQEALLGAIAQIADLSPFRHMVTPGGFRMSVAMTNCGSQGWVTDRRGYRYQETDPTTGLPWSPMPPAFLELAQAASTAAGFSDFVPDACLVNRYEPGSRLTLHQDKNEREFHSPIVSVSLGLPATFLFGGLERNDKTQRIEVKHGDVLVWGGPSRLRYHGILPLKAGNHTRTGPYRYNLTFRKAA